MNDDNPCSDALQAASVGTWEADLLTETAQACAQSMTHLGVASGGARLTLDALFAHVHPDDRQRVRAATAAIRSGPSDFDVQFRSVWSDGSVHSILARGARLPADSARAQRIVGVTFEMRYATRPEHLVATPTESWMRAAETLGLAAWEWRTGDNRQSWSPAQERLYGLAPASFDGRLDSFLALVHPEDHELLRARSARLPATGEQQYMEFRVVRADGSAAWIGSRTRTVMDATGEPYALVGIDEDISERKALEEERERALASEQRLRQRAETNNRSHDAFLGLVSHELRAPLNAILGWSRVLGLKRGEDPDVIETVARIERSAKVQLQLIEDLLDTARIASGALELERTPVTLLPLITTAIDALRAAAQAKGIELSSDLDPSGAQVLGDAQRLQQIVAALLSNAIKYTPRGARALVRLTRNATHARILIEDTGQGITAERLPHIFERSLEGDGPSTSRQAGLGLGLAMVQQLVALHGGSVAAASAGEGRGASFTVELPLFLSERGGAVKEPFDYRSTRWKLDDLSVLIVDDEPEARALIKTALESYGAQVEESDSVTAALHLLTHDSAVKQRFDVLVSDIAMPGEDGYSLLRRLRAWEREHGGRLPALALTGHAGREDRRQAFAVGFDRHLAKPVDIAQLVDEIVTLPLAQSAKH